MASLLPNASLIIEIQHKRHVIKCDDFQAEVLPDPNPDPNLDLNFDLNFYLNNDKSVNSRNPCQHFL